MLRASGIVVLRAILPPPKVCSQMGKQGHWVWGTKDLDCPVRDTPRCGNFENRSSVIICLTTAAVAKDGRAIVRSSWVSLVVDLDRLSENRGRQSGTAMVDYPALELPERPPSATPTFADGPVDGPGDIIVSSLSARVAAFVVRRQ
ncbi:hypothetical protein Micbo1qcDRAFT_53457 [Microdochium bolleyi]|uniref:Uncharacterized protein n=1 Tax=Microdochium bolleyi TaxID=196109 RepID=A0A136J7J4_9PEZI|nr:hypothetical protein Micbo1qcDRAFT_53457 [Microdochium bolleyi]